MANIGKYTLPKRVQEEINQQLVKALLRTDKRTGSAILEELLTDTERIMLAKRLAAIYMLIDDHSYYRIEQVLGMSTSTSKRLHSLLIGGAFGSVEKLIERSKKSNEIMEYVGILLRAGMPPRAYIIKKRK